MDSFKQHGKYLKGIEDKSEHSLKRPVQPQISTERIRDIFDSQDSFKGQFNTPDSTYRVMMDINFGRKLPALGCCADCMCGITESYTSDALINGSIYVTTPYVAESTVVYLDGIRSFNYTEANPATGQIAILVPASAIVISYVYTVGNCTESQCIERFPCVGYSILNLVTVFSDRFDRSQTLSAIPAGGCGVWASFYSSGIYTLFTPSNVGGSASFNGQFAVLNGGSHVVGKTVEVVLATGPLIGTQGVTLSNTFETMGFSFNYVNETTKTLIIGGSFDGINGSDVLTSDGVTMSTTWNTPNGELNADSNYFIRCVQAPGFWAIKLWIQGQPEPASYDLVVTIADAQAQNDLGLTDIELIQPTPDRVLLDIDFLQAIQVGAGLDPGRWGFGSAGSGQGWFGDYCAVIPDGLTRFGYNCGVNGAGTVATSSASLPSAVASISFPSFVDPTGLGRLAEYNETMASTGTLNGHPNGVIVRGEISAGDWGGPTAAVPVLIKAYPSFAGSTFGINGFSGGVAVGSATLPVDGTWQPIQFTLPSGGLSNKILWGVTIPNLDGVAQASTYHDPFPLFPSNFPITVSFRNVRMDGIQSVNCTTDEFCKGCADDRCVPVIDFFTDNTVLPFGTAIQLSAPYIRSMSQGSSYLSKGVRAEVTFASNEMSVIFNNVGGTGASARAELDYASPFDCNYVGNLENYEATFEVFMGTPGSNETSFIEFGGFTEGWQIDFNSVNGVRSTTSSFLTILTGSLPTLNNDQWYNVKVRLEGQYDSFIKIWSGTEPADWTVTGTSTEILQGWGFFFSTSFSTGSSTFTPKIRNVDIRRL